MKTLLIPSLKLQASMPAPCLLKAFKIVSSKMPDAWTVTWNQDGPLHWPRNLGGSQDSGGATRTATPMRSRYLNKK